MLNDLPCPVCGVICHPLDVVDFNKSCVEESGNFLPLSGIPIYYYLCAQCNFCFAPEMYKWALDEFSQKVYNPGYAEIDPHYKTIRPQVNADNINNIFGDKKSSIKHLDYGGGNGLLSDLLSKWGWDSDSYDPFVNHDINIKDLGLFDFITAFEVFEHVPDVNELMFQLNTLIKNDSIIYFTTLVSDGNIEKNKRLNWWYASPRNGHISIFSKVSLAILAKKYQLNLVSLSSVDHMLFKQVPNWAPFVVKK